MSHFKRLHAFMHVPDHSNRLHTVLPSAQGLAIELKLKAHLLESHMHVA